MSIEVWIESLCIYRYAAPLQAELLGRRRPVSVQQEPTIPDDRRHPRRQFDPALIRSFLEGRQIESAQLLPSGRSNTNYKLVLRGGEVFVLRLFGQGNGERERYIMNLVKDLVPVPREVARGNDWSILSFVEGVHLADVPEYTHAAAQALARVSSVEFASPGWINTDGSITPFNFGDGKGFVASMLERPDVQTWIGQEAVTSILEILDADARRREASATKSCLVHGDFNPTNILIQDGAVSGILDWEFAHSGDPYMDIGNLLRHTPPAYHNQIHSGLEAGGVTLPDDWKKRAEFIDLTSHLEFLTTQRSDDFKRQCVAWIHGFIERYSCD
jgi:aminoglycoside phosphotransferase (APT) family kinase protein